MAYKRDKYGLAGAIIGGALLGFVVFGGVAMHLIARYRVSMFVALCVAIVGAVIGAYSQVKRGDTLWKELTGKWW